MNGVFFVPALTGPSLMTVVFLYYICTSTKGGRLRARSLGTKT